MRGRRSRVTQPLSSHGRPAARFRHQVRAGGARQTQEGEDVAPPVALGFGLTIITGSPLSAATRPCRAPSPRPGPACSPRSPSWSPRRAVGSRRPRPCAAPPTRVAGPLPGRDRRVRSAVARRAGQRRQPTGDVGGSVTNSRLTSCGARCVSLLDSFRATGQTSCEGQCVRCHPPLFRSSRHGRSRRVRTAIRSSSGHVTMGDP